MLQLCFDRVRTLFTTITAVFIAVTALITSIVTAPFKVVFKCVCFNCVMTDTTVFTAVNTL